MVPCGYLALNPGGWWTLVLPLLAFLSAFSQRRGARVVAGVLTGTWILVVAGLAIYLFVLNPYRPPALTPLSLESGIDESLLEQVLGNLHTADAVMAVDHKSGLPVELVESGRNGAHGDV